MNRLTTLPGQYNSNSECMDHLGTQEKLDPKERNGECNELKILHSGKLMKALRLSATSASVVIFPILSTFLRATILAV